MLSNPPLNYGPDLVGAASADPVETENYEALLNLAERLGEAKPRGLARTQIDQLPSYRFAGEIEEGGQSTCVICMCEFETRQTLRVLPCSHEYHAKCIDKWLKVCVRLQYYWPVFGGWGSMGSSHLALHPRPQLLPSPPSGALGSSSFTLLAPPIPSAFSRPSHPSPPLPPAPVLTPPIPTVLALFPFELLPFLGPPAV